MSQMRSFFPRDRGVSASIRPMPLWDKLQKLIPGKAGPAPVGFEALTTAARHRAEEWLHRTPAPLAAPMLVELLDGRAGAIESGYVRVLEQVDRRCADAEIWQNFFLDLLDDEGDAPVEGPGMGAQPVEPDEELLRLLAGITRWPEVRPRFAWETGYHTLRHVLARRDADAALVVAAAKAAVEDFLLAFGSAGDYEAKVNALGDLAAALFIAGDDETGRLLCDYAAGALSAEEAVRQELHRLRREGASFVRESYGAS